MTHPVGLAWAGQCVGVALAVVAEQGLVLVEWWSFCCGVLLRQWVGVFGL